MPNTDKSNLKKISSNEFLRLIGSERQIMNFEISDEIFIDSNSLTFNKKTISLYNCKFSKLTIQLVLTNLTINDCDFDKIDIKRNINDLEIFNINSDTAIILVNNADIQSIKIDNCEIKLPVILLNPCTAPDNLFELRHRLNSLVEDD